jgi:hypothetical protein
MKKVESVLNGFLGCAKARSLNAFPQILFGLLFLILPKIFIIQGGEGGASASHPRVETLSRRLDSSNLTIQKKVPGEIYTSLMTDRWIDGPGKYLP